MTEKTTELWSKNFEWRVDTWDENGIRIQQHAGVYLDTSEEPTDRDDPERKIQRHSNALLEAIEQVLSDNEETMHELYKHIASNIE